jgi:hypothetical protein
MTAVLNHVIDLERQLHVADFRRDRERLEALLTPDFTEISMTGQVQDRGAIIDYLQREVSDLDIQALGFTARAVTDDVILVHYDTSGPSGFAHRTSLWVRYFQSWRMAFHQATLS